jgi:hypothetical protein
MARDPNAMWAGRDAYPQGDALPQLTVPGAAVSRGDARRRIGAIKTGETDEDHVLKPLALSVVEFYDLLLDRDLLDGHESTPPFRYGAIASKILLSINAGGH